MLSLIIQLHTLEMLSLLKQKPISLCIYKFLLVTEVSTQDINYFAFRTVRQGVFSRTPKFDGTQQKILTVLDVINKVKPPGLWLNIQVLIQF